MDMHEHDGEHLCESLAAPIMYHGPRNYYVNNLQGNNFHVIVIVTWQQK